MSESKVADIVKGEIDATGVKIDTVYSKVTGTYAVYRTSERVVVQFADEEKLGSEQRLALSPLNPIRGEINGLIDGWRASTKADRQAKAKLFDRRVADALIVALQGDQPHAVELLTALKADILEERTSVARTEYLIIAFVSAIVLIAILGLSGTWLFTSVVQVGPQGGDDAGAMRLLPWAAAVGAVGALFSIALAIRGRSILTDLQSRDNAVDEILRVMIGATSAAILFCLLAGNVVNFGLGGEDLSLATPANMIVVAFVAGFSERLVGDFLTTPALIGASASTNPIAGGIAPRTASPGAPEANEQNPLGLQSPVKQAGTTSDVDSGRKFDLIEGDDVDCCLADVTLSEEELTDDSELPEASGGVESRVRDGEASAPNKTAEG